MSFTRTPPLSGTVADLAAWANGLVADAGPKAKYELHVGGDDDLECVVHKPRAHVLLRLCEGGLYDVLTEMSMRWVNCVADKFSFDFSWHREGSAGSVNAIVFDSEADAQKAYQVMVAMGIGQAVHLMDHETYVKRQPQCMPDRAREG